MPEPRVTSSRLLALTIEQQQQPEDIPAHTTASPKDKHRKRSSTSSNDTTAESNSTSSRRRPGTTKTLNTGSDASSSRAAQRSTASPNNTSTMSTVNYTKTGRVSKAKKGLKVHNCECGRSYTRAEHLRRHQRNHAQEGAMVCKYPNCGKSFYRSDLLQRHEERHDELGNVSRQPSVSSTEYSPHASPVTAPASLSMIPASTLSPDVLYPQQQVISPQPEVTPFPRYNPSLFRTPQLPRTPKIAPINPNNHVFQSCPNFKTPPNDLKHHNLVYPTRHSTSDPVMVDGMATSGAWHDSFAQSPYSCSSGYASPAPVPEYGHMYATPPYGSGVVRTRASSNASFIEQTWAHASQSPTSSISMPYPSWPSDEKNIIVSSFAYTPVSYPTANMPMHASIGAMAHYGNYDPRNVVQMDNEEGAQLFPGEHYGMSQIACTHPFEQHLNNYWRFFHPTFPVVHRFTFASLEPSHMLYDAMIAIGAYYSNDVDYARKLHDRCMELLDKSIEPNENGCDRLCDYQAIFLVEVFAQYFSRRCARTFSTRFLVMYEKLVEILSTDPSAITDPVPHASTHEDNIQDRWLQWVKLSVKQRLLISCYLLEYRQSTLLTPHHKRLMSHILEDDLPFPSHKSLWDARDPYQWSNAAQEYSLMPRRVSEATNNRMVGYYDPFQSSVLIAAHYNPFSSLTFHLSGGIDSLIHHDEATRHQLLTAKLTQLVPMRALLAVSGETWVLGTKVTSQPEFFALKTTLQAWASELWSTHTEFLLLTAEAFKISVAILQLSLEASKPVVLDMGNELGLLVAALVLWAVTAAATTRIMANEQSPQLNAVSMGQSISGSVATTHSTYPSSMIQVIGLRQQAPQALVTSSSRRSSVPHSEIKANISRFLDTAVDDIESLNIDVEACQNGCTSLLLWLKMRLRGGSLNNEGHPVVGMTSSASAQSAFVKTILDHIEKMLKHGWEGWGI